MRRLLIVDDHPIFRNCLRLALAEAGDFGEIVEAGSGAEARAALGASAFDLVLLDQGLPDASGLEILEAAARSPGAPLFFILTMSADASLAKRAFTLGAAGFASKNIALGTLVLALRLVLAGELYLEAEIFRDLLSSAQEAKPGAAESAELRGRVDSLSERERAVLEALLEGLAAKEAAVRLGVSRRTAENYQSAVYAKLGARSPVDLIRIALAAGLLRD